MLSNHSSGLDIILLKMIIKPVFTRQTFTVQEVFFFLPKTKKIIAIKVLYEPLGPADEKELTENVEFIIPDASPLSTEFDISSAKEDSKNLENLRRWAIENNVGPIMVLFENARSNNSCVLGIVNQLRGDIYKHYMRTKEHIPMIEISYRDNQYVTPVNTTKSGGLLSNLKILMNPVNSVRVKFGILKDKNLSSNLIVIKIL